MIGVRITAPCGTGPVRWNHTRYPLRDIDYDYDLLGHNRYTERVAPTIDDNIDVLTSCRDGPVHAGKEELGMHELPVFRHLLICYSLDKRPHYM